MENTIELYLKNYSDTIPQSSLNKFKNLFTKITVPKGDVLLNQGDITTKFYIVESGLVASFINFQDEHDVIRRIYKKLDEFGSLTSLLKKENTRATFKCLTDAVVLEASYKDFLALIKEDSVFSIIYTKALEKLYIIADKRFHQLSSLDATERYLQLKKEITSIDNLLPQYEIAKYLNITPVQLSRVRKKLYSK